MKPLIAGNWKMNGLSASSSMIEALIADFSGAMPDSADVLICPPATLISSVIRNYSDEGIMFGGQDCHPKTSGAYTGEISAEMLADVGAAFVIVGHSERRTYNGETDAFVRQKAEAALRAGLTPIICVGESESLRDAGDAVEFVCAQLRASTPDTSNEIVIAYEPIWAIGTGRTPTAAEIEAMHSALRRVVGDKTRILYGGSVNATNARQILGLGNVNGSLVGGASLKADDFAAIIRSV
jgi:triosephosphate isomerase